MQFQVLGPLAVRDDAGRLVELGGPRQRAVLARLLVAGGRVVPADRVVDDLWQGEPPPRALGALQAYVSHLRRALEPERERRAPARVLVSVAPGYALRAEPGQLDAEVFEDELRLAAEAAPAAALELLDRALGRWAGPAYAEVAAEDWARAEAVRLEELRQVARERRAAALLAVGDPARAVAELEALVHDVPLREGPWRMLALALYRAGRQGDALSALRRARDTLAEELGIDPGQGLRDLEAALLAQDPALDVPPASARAGSLGSARATATAPAPPAAAPGRVPEPRTPAPRPTGLVGRGAELDRLIAAADATLAGRPAVALVGGEPGIGKSALAGGLADRLVGDGWLVAWGRCPEVAGAPPLWPWTEVARTVSEAVPPTTEELAALGPLSRSAHAPVDDAPTARFLLHRALAGWLRRAAGARPLLVVLDDVHRADEGTLVALRELVAPHDPGRLLVVATYRPAEAGAELVETLAALAGHDPVRIDLAGLDPADVDRLVRGVVAEDQSPDEPTDDVVAAIASRTGGNPFYVREVARLLASEGALVATSEVPAGVRDVIRRRLGRLPDTAQSVLRTAAVIGRDVPVDLLVAVEPHPEDDVLDAVETGVVAGLLEEPAPGRVRFAHALVRYTIYDDLPMLRRSRAHARVAAALEAQAPDDLDGLAHHYLQAAGAGYATQAVRALRAAAVRAERRIAFGSAADLWAQALQAHALVGAADPRERVELLCGLAHAQHLAGRSKTARRTRADAVAAAADLGDPRLVARAVTSNDAPMLWNNRGYLETDVELVETGRRALAALGADDLALRARLLSALSIECAHWLDAAAARSYALEAVDLASRLEDPAVTAVALHAAFGSVRNPDDFEQARGWAQRLTELGRDHGMPGVQTLGLTGLMSMAAARWDVDEASRYAGEADAVVRRYELPIFPVQLRLFDVWRDWVRTGDGDATLEGYERVVAMPEARDMWDIHDLHVLAITAVRHVEGRLPEIAGAVEALGAHFPDQTAPLLAMLDAARGDVELGRRRLGALKPPVRDYIWLLVMGFRADAALAVGAADLAPDLLTELRPWAQMTHGGETHSMEIGPVAVRLARLAELVGRTDEAREHWRTALEVARRARSPYWERVVREGMAALDA